MQYKRPEKSTGNKRSATLQAASARGDKGRVLENNRITTTAPVQKKGNRTDDNPDPKDGIVQGVWYDSDGNKHKGNPPSGYRVVRTTNGDYWEPETDSEESSEEKDNSDDGDYVETEKSAKNKKKDPKSGIKKGTLKRKAAEMEYETDSGIKHKEEYDTAKRRKITESEGLQYTPQYRNPAHRDPGMYHVHNHSGLSVGQQGRNQMVVSHNTPSWAGMQAGKDFGNSSLTSPGYNAEIEQKEKKFRSLVENSNKPFSYKTETEYEDVLSDDASDIEKEIKKEYKKSKWDKDRVKKRIKNVKAKYPDASRVKKEVRTITTDKTSSTFSKKRDMLAYLPARAYSEDAHKKYIEARGQDSQGSDDELEAKSAKKSKKKK